MRLRTVKHCLEALAAEFAWRKKELIDFRLCVVARTDAQKSLFIRAGVPLAYAHWEGFVKNSTEHLLNYVSNLALKNADLNDAFFAHSAKSQIASLLETNQVANATLAAVYLRDCANENAIIRHKNYVDSGSNLSSKVFEQIANSIGIDTKDYKYLYPYIDESIVHRRNQVAHGESVSLSESDFKAMIDRVIDLTYMYLTDLQNIAVQGSFRRATRQDQTSEHAL